MVDNLSLKIKVTADPHELLRGLQTSQEALFKTFSAAQKSVEGAKAALEKANREAEGWAKAMHQAEGSGLGAAMVQDFEAASEAVRAAQAALDQERASLLSAGQAVSKNADEMNRMAEGAKAAAGGAAGLKNVAQAAKEAGENFEKAASFGSRFWNILNGVAAWGFGSLGLSGISNLSRLTDEYGQMASRIKMVSNSTEEFEAIQARLADTADRTYRPLAEAQELYIRSADAIKSLGYGTQQALDITDSLSYLMVKNAASGERAASAISAFSTALQTGEVHALQWKSLLAAVPSLVEDLAKSTGKSTDEIRKMGAQGKISVEMLTEALRKFMGANQKAAADMPVTMADAFNKLRNNLQKYLGSADEAWGATQKLTGLLGVLGDNIGTVLNAAVVALGAKLLGLSFNLALSTKSFIHNTAENLKNATAKRANAQAALLAARAEMQAAQAALVSAKAQQGATAGTTAAIAAKHNLAAANARLALAEQGLAAASAASAASRITLSGSLLTVGRFLMGPWGIALAAGAALLTGFSGKTREATQSQLDFSASLEDVEGKFKALSKTQREAEIVLAQKKRDEALESFGKKAKEAFKAGFDETGLVKQHLDGYTAETMLALTEFQQLISKARETGEADYDALTAAIGRMGEVSDEKKDKLRLLVAEMQKSGDTAQAASEQLRRLADIQAGLGKETPSAKPIEPLEKALEKAREAAGEAKLYAAAANAAQLDGRAEKAKQYAEQAKKAMETAAREAEKLSDADAAKRIYEDLGEAEARSLEAEAKAKEAQLTKMQEAAQAQEEQIATLEKRLDELAEKARQGKPVTIEIEDGLKNITHIKDALDNIKDKDVTINVHEKRTQESSGSGGGGTPAGFYSGGYTGNLGMGKIAGVVHGQEHVTRAEMVRQPGARGFLDLFNRIGMAAIPLWLKTAKIPGYKAGGFVAPPHQGALGENLIPAVFNFPGVGKIPAQLAPNVADELSRALKIETLMKGRRG